MATKRKRKSPARKKRNTNTPQIKSEIRSEVLFFASLAFVILLFLSNFQITSYEGEKTSIIGALGDSLRGIQFGLFGVMAYPMAFIIFFSIFFGIVNIENKLAILKLICGNILVIMITISCALIGDIDKAGTTIIQYYLYSKDNSKGGGVLGALLGKGMVSFLGTIGTVIVLILLSIICIVIITEKSILSGMKKGGSAVYETAKQESMQLRDAVMTRREQKLLAPKEEKKPRREKHVKGVVLDTKIDKNESDEDMHEIITQNEEQVTLEALDHITFRGEGLQEETIKEEPAKGEPVKTKPAKEESSLDMTRGLADYSNYKFPPRSLLLKGAVAKTDSKNQLKETALRLQQTLQTFGVKVTVTDISQGPAVTRYELQPEVGVKVSKIVNLADDIKLNLAATDIRIEAPIPGKAAIGIEVPNKENSAVCFRDLIESKEFESFSSKLSFAVGKDIGGKIIVADIAKMPHMLIAGATGSGKSVCINTLIMSILYKAHPDEVKLIMIDPKVVELSVYNGIPHLMIPVVTEPKKAAAALQWGVSEMTDRYKKFADLNVRDLSGYNKKVKEMTQNDGKVIPDLLPQVVIIVDELADLMMVAPGEVEESICRLAQLARAAGIHLIIATQRPSVDVITGLIKANMPSRIAFSVSSGVDSRTILDMNGAEKLLGKGDMLFYPQGVSKPSRVQGAFISDKEVSDIVDFLKKQCSNTTYSKEVEEKIAQSNAAGTSSIYSDAGSGRDEYFVDAAKFIIDKDKASIGMLQRVFKIGFNRAARIMDQLYEAGIVGEEEGTKPRKILMTMDEFDELMEEIL